MDAPAIESTLAEAESRVEGGEGLSGSGFWRVVGRVKRNPELAERYADRIARIDDAAFRDWAWLVIPIRLGTTLALLATAGGLFLVGWAYTLVDRGADTAALVSFFLGFGVILVTTHGLGHLAVGRALGIRFTAWFVGGLTQPQPGVKIDYSSYLRSTPERRAWTHAAGAIVTKIVPFVLIGAARVAGLPDWVTWALVALGVAMVATDLLWSTKSSDWARFRRERAIGSH
jgi:hypothetical protein